jgi:sulfate adenylyltransferase subunit 1
MNKTCSNDRGVLRFLTCGSVDDGKSTLIGRLLLDSKVILVDALDALAASSRKRGLVDELDLSLLTDGLEAEREQGITIDVAYRYFSTGTRNYILADTPGHEQYTRNMVTGASTAELAIVLIDARKGVLPQTRRHLAVAHLMGLRQVVVAVNKMDLAAWDEGRFQAIRAEVEDFSSRLGLKGLRFLPLSALKGDMVVARGARLPWYGGPTLMEILETVTLETASPDAPFRFPVQLVCRPRQEPYREFRGYQGRVESGHVAVGEAIKVLPGGARSRVSGVEFSGEHRLEALCGQSVTLLLKDDLDISRGDLLAGGAEVPEPITDLVATLCWLDEAPLDPAARLLLRHGTRTVRARVADLIGCLDLQTQSLQAARELRMNDIARVVLLLQQPIAPDPYRDVRQGGAFILIDENTNATVAAGMVLGPKGSVGPLDAPC